MIDIKCNMIYDSYLYCLFLYAYANFLKIKEIFFFSDYFSFAHSSVLSSYIYVLRTYATNTPYFNHCIIRMLYRVSVDCNFAGILFQMSLFRILQKFHLDPLAKSKQFAVKFSFIKKNILFT